MEYWDIYDEFKNKTGKVLKGGDKQMMMNII